MESVTFDSAEVVVVAGAASGTIKLWDLEEAKSKHDGLPFMSMGDITSILLSCRWILPPSGFDLLYL